MKFFLGTLSIILFINFQNVPAQNRYSISLGGGYISSSIDQTKLPYWNNGYLFNLIGEYKVSDKTSLFLSSSWQKHLYQQNLVQITHPEVVGFNYSISGEKSNVYEISGGGKFYLTGSRIKPYVSAGIGALLINQGKVEISTWMDTGVNKSVGLWQDSDKSYLLAQVNLNLGLEYNLTENFYLVVNGQLISGLMNGPVYFPVTTALKITL